MKFGMKENDPFRIFGLPKNMLLEVCWSSSPLVFLLYQSILTRTTLDSSVFSQNHVPLSETSPSKQSICSTQRVLTQVGIHAPYSVRPHPLTPPVPCDMLLTLVCAVAGDPGSGKSFALLQAVQYAIERKWIVIYIPRGSSPLLVTSSPNLANA